MFSLEILSMVGAILFVLGGLVGAILTRSFAPAGQQKELEQSLQLTRQELNQYQQEVAQHFAETSKLVNSLTQNYKDVHEHLARGAIKLTNPDISKQILEAGEGTLGIEGGEAISDLQPEPPRDWAPKTPGQTGTLSEEYGLDDDKSDEDAPPENYQSSKTGS